MLKLSHQISIPQTKPAWPPSEAWRNLVSQILEELALYIPKDIYKHKITTNNEVFLTIHFIASTSQYTVQCTIVLLLY